MTNAISTLRMPHLSRDQYLRINKLVNFNFTFDDQWDELFIHNFKITKMLSPKPIVYELVLPQLQMTADYSTSERRKDSQWKLFTATINEMSMTYRRTKQLDSSMTFSLGLTQLLAYEYQDGLKDPREHELLTLERKPEDN